MDYRGLICHHSKIFVIKTILAGIFQNPIQGFFLSIYQNSSFLPQRSFQMWIWPRLCTNRAAKVHEN